VATGIFSRERSAISVQCKGTIRILQIGPPMKREIMITIAEVIEATITIERGGDKCKIEGQVRGLRTSKPTVKTSFVKKMIGYAFFVNC